MEEKISEVLSSIGLNKTEVKVYLDLTKSNISSALDISKRTKIYRANVYDTLRRLSERGFVKETIKDNKKAFQAIEPEKIKDYLKQKEQEIDFIIPKIKEFANNKKESESVTMMKGIFSMREALSGLLELGQPINILGISQKAIEKIGEGFMKEFHKQRIKKKVLIRQIYNENAEDSIKELNRMENTEARFLPKKFESLVSTSVCGDTVIMAIFNDNISVIEIKNKDIASAYNRYFDLLWNHANK